MTDTAVEQYGIRIPNDEIQQRMLELDKPHHDEEVLKYLHFELGLSSGEIGAVFGVARQTIQKVVREFDWEFHRDRGGNRVPDENQKLLTDYQETGLSDFL